MRILEESFTRHRRFVADASHELRTPVAAIRSLTDLALSQEFTSDESRALFKNINSESERLGHLISDLLALARSDEGRTQLDCEPVRLDVLIEAVAANAELLAQERGIILRIQTPNAITFVGDEARLIQVVMNLLDNAILYTNTGGQVTVALVENEAQIVLSVHDTGRYCTRTSFSSL